MRPFEEDIVRRYRAASKIRASPTAEWIKNHLLEVGEDYTYNMWKLFRKFAEEARINFGVRIRVGTYQSFTRYIHVLKTLKLIIPTRKMKGKPRPKQLYALNPDKIKVRAWKHPYQALYPVTSTSYRRRHGLPIPRKRTGRPRGRPRKTYL